MPTLTQEIAIPRKIVQNLLHHAQQTPDIEVCGLISGKNGIPLQSYPINNSSDKPSRFFTLDPQQQISAMAEMRDNKQELFAIYHSHPAAPAVPSKTDLEQVGYPNALYLIISLNVKGIMEIRGYQLHDTSFTEVGLAIS